MGRSKVEIRKCYREVSGYSVDMNHGWIEGMERDAELDWSEGRSYVVEYGVYGGVVEDLWRVVEGVRYSGTVKVFRDKDEEAWYYGERKMVHGGEFLHKDFENPLSVFYPGFEKKMIRKKG
jgi:hypothetical protein